MHSATYQTVTGQEFQHPACPPQAAPVPPNSAAAEVLSWIQHHAAQVYQWRQMVNVEDILKQQILESLDEKYFNGKRQAYINYAGRTMSGIIHNLYGDHGKISPMEIEESE